MHPPTSEELQALAEAGKLDDCLAHVRRFGNHRAHPALLKKAWERTFGYVVRPEGEPNAERKSGLTPPPAWRGLPTTGVRKVFALLIEFQDDRHCNSPADIGRGLFGRTANEGGSESLASYYERSSYRNLDLYGGTTLGWYRTTYPRTAVDQSVDGRVRLIKEALEHFHSLGTDFGEYDTNSDGIVDYFLVIWAGKDTGYCSPCWWAFQEYFNDENYSLDGVGFGPYAWMWESRPVGSPFDLATAIHETGHALGVPDLYDGDPEQGPLGGVGKLDMMDGLKYDHNCFSKWLLNWVTPWAVTRGSQKITLRPSGSAPDCVLIWPGARPDAMFAEFFMAEYRTSVGNDANLPGDGLLIWHIDATLQRDDSDFAFNNWSTKHKLVRLIEADGLEEIEAGKLADAGDFYRAGMSFGVQTFPSSAGYRLRRSGVTVSDIVQAPWWITATFAIR
jgi:M6 family metalloprotease-like protein